MKPARRPAAPHPPEEKPEHRSNHRLQWLAALTCLLWIAGPAPGAEATLAGYAALAGPQAPAAEITRAGYATLAGPKAPAAEVTPADYPALTGPKALAVAPGQSQTYGIAFEQVNDLTASMLALRACETRRDAASGPCEIRRLNDERITPGHEILAAVPQGPHPLYLWRFTGKRSVVYLAGSIHVLKESLYPLPQEYETAFNSADHLVVEINTAAVAPFEMQQKSRQYTRLPEDQRLSDILPPATHANLMDQLTRYGLANADIEGAKPSFLMNQLVVARLLALGYLQEFGVEQFFFERLLNRNVIELETIDTQLRLMFEQPLDIQVALLEEALEQADDIEPILSDMLVAWLSGDDERLQALFEVQTGDSELISQFNKQLLDDRNIGMAEKARALVEEGTGTYFVLVGAAHFLGKSGIISLLEGQGLRGERIMTGERRLSTQQARKVNP